VGGSRRRSRAGPFARAAVVSSSLALLPSRPSLRRRSDHGGRRLRREGTWAFGPRGAAFGRRVTPRCKRGVCAYVNIYIYYVVSLRSRNSLRSSNKNISKMKFDISAALRTFYRGGLMIFRA